MVAPAKDYTSRPHADSSVAQDAPERKSKIVPGTLRSKLAQPKPRTFVKPIPGQDPLDTLKAHGNFTVYDFQAVTGLALAHCVRVMYQLANERIIAATPWRGLYYVTDKHHPTPVNTCYALVPYTQAAPQFAVRYIRAFVLEQYSPSDDCAPVTDDPCPF